MGTASSRDVTLACEASDLPEFIDNRWITSWQQAVEDLPQCSTGSPRAQEQAAQQEALQHQLADSQATVRKTTAALSALSAQVLDLKKENLSLSHTLGNLRAEDSTLHQAAASLQASLTTAEDALAAERQQKEHFESCLGVAREHILQLAFRYGDVVSLNASTAKSVTLLEAEAHIRAIRYAADEAAHASEKQESERHLSELKAKLSLSAVSLLEAQEKAAVLHTDAELASRQCTEQKGELQIQISSLKAKLNVQGNAVPCQPTYFEPPMTTYSSTELAGGLNFDSVAQTTGNLYADSPAQMAGFLQLGSSAKPINSLQINSSTWTDRHLLADSFAETSSLAAMVGSPATESGKAVGTQAVQLFASAGPAASGTAQQAGAAVAVAASMPTSAVMAPHVSANLAAGSTADAARKSGHVKSTLEQELQVLLAETGLPRIKWTKEYWQLHGPVSTSQNSGVFHVTNPFWPNVVLKQAPLEQVMLEARAQHAARHPGVLPVVGIVTTREVSPEGYPLAYLALQMAGCSLADHLKTHRLTARQKLVGCQQLAAGLAQLHSKSLAHHDFRTGNVLVGLGGVTLLLADVGSTAPANKTAAIVHDPLCCRGLEPPEVATALLADGCFKPHYAADIWMLGHLILELMGAPKPKAHQQLLTSPGWNATVHLVQTDLLSLPPMKSHLEYLSNLKTLPGPLDDYASQVQFPASTGLNNAEQTAAIALQQIACACLRVDPQRRPSSVDVQRTLYATMKQLSWTNNLNDT